MNQKRKEIKKDFSVIGEEPTQQAGIEVVEATHVPMSFDAWWLQTQSKYKLKPELKEAVRKHFASRGFLNDSRKFDKGLRDFGYNT
jgi:hypothetical protein